MRLPGCRKSALFDSNIANTRLLNYFFLEVTATSAADMLDVQADTVILFIINDGK